MMVAKSDLRRECGRRVSGWRARAPFALGAGRMSRREFLRRGAGAAAVAGLGIGGLAACGGDEEGSSGSGASATIEYWHVNTETFGGPTIKELVRRFNERNPNITVKERFHGEDSYTSLLEDLQIAQAAGTPPDVAQIGYSNLDYVANNFPFSGPEELGQEFGGGDLLAAFPSNVLALGRSGGELAGMPYALSEPIAFYNADMLSEAGLDAEAPPLNWEGWTAAAEVVRGELDKPGLCFTLFPGNTFFGQTMIESNGGRLLGCSGDGATAAFDGPEAVEAFGLWADLAEKGLMLNAVGEQGSQAFLSGGVPVLFDATSQLQSYKGQADFDLRGAPFPTFGGKQARLATGGNTLFVFAEEEARRRAAWTFVRFLLSSESMELWARETGYLPTREGVQVGDDPVMQIALDQRPLVEPWVSFPGPNGLQASQVLYDAQEAALGGQSSAEQALGDAADEVDELIEGQDCPS